MKKILIIFMAVMMSFAAGFAVLPNAIAIQDADICNDITDPDLRKAAGCDEAGTLPGEVNKIYDVIIGIVGILSVVVIIISGVIMATSAGDPSKVAKGKKGVIYGIVGLVVSLLAFAIVNFVLSNVF